MADNFVTPHRMALLEERMARQEAVSAELRRELDGHKTDLILLKEEMTLLRKAVTDMTDALPAAVGKVVEVKIEQGMRNLRRATVWGAPFLGALLTIFNLWKAFT